MRFDEPRMRQMFFKSAQDRVETFHVPHLQDQAVARGQIRQFGSMRGVVSNRLFNQHMFVLHKERPRNRVVRVGGDRKSTRLNSSHANISYAVFCLKKK